MSSQIVVVGSINMDLIVETPRHPKPGETVLGTRFSTCPGGKGANQAVAAARLGASVKLIGAVGQDPYGKTLTQALADERIDTGHVRSMSSVASGVAFITVDASGQNSIVVSPGANNAVTAEIVRESEECFVGAKVVLVQLEVSLPATREAIRLGKKHGARVILNPAPALPLPDDIIPEVDDFIPNQSELSLLTGEEDLTRGVERLHQRGAKRVIVTLGCDGALLSEGMGQPSVSLATFEVRVVDTTAAGDAFVGAYGVALAEGRSVSDALRWGLGAGALAVTRLGAQRSLPSRSDLESLLKEGALKKQ